MTPPLSRAELDEIAKKREKRLRKLRREAAAGLRRALGIRPQLERLRGVSDEEWQAAVEAEEAEEA